MLSRKRRPEERSFKRLHNEGLPLADFPENWLECIDERRSAMSIFRG
jgi:hypothetical protein